MFLSPKEAYDLFLRKYPEAQSHTIIDIGDYYSISRAPEGSFVDDTHYISKLTGEICAMDFVDEMAYLSGIDKSITIIKEYRF